MRSGDIHNDVIELSLLLLKLIIVRIDKHTKMIKIIEEIINKSVLFFIILPLENNRKINMSDIQYIISKKLCNDLVSENQNLFYKLALVMLKPECLAMNKVDNAIQILIELGFEPVFIKIKRLTQNQVVSLWQHGWKKANTERIILNIMAATWNDSAVIILRDTKRTHEDSCVFLNSLKGSSINSSSNKQSIRGRLGTINNYLNFIHCSDNYNEFVREVFILLEISEIIELLHSIESNNVYTHEIISDMFRSYTNVLKVGDINLRFNTYINTLMQNKNTQINNLLHQQLEMAYKKRVIPTNLFIELLKEGMIQWTWEEILIFTSFTKFG